MDKIEPFSGRAHVAVFDIDDTLIRLKTGRCIESTRQLLNHCRDKDFTIVILTARPSILKLFTVSQLSMYNIQYHILLMNPNINITDKSIGQYKTRCRERLQRQGYNILLNVGNIPSDFQDGFYKFNLTVSRDEL